MQEGTISNWIVSGEIEKIKYKTTAESRDADLNETVFKEIQDRSVCSKNTLLYNFSEN